MVLSVVLKSKSDSCHHSISNPEFAKEFISRVDGLLLAGGQDVSPLLYGEEPHLNLARTYPARDAFEIELIKEAYRQHKPIFAVCRGLQIFKTSLLAEHSTKTSNHNMKIFL